MKEEEDAYLSNRCDANQKFNLLFSVFNDP